MNLRFLEIVPKAARAVNDRFENTVMKPDASNLASVLVHLKETTKSPDRPNGVLSEIVADLAFLIPSVSTLEVHDDPKQRQFSFSLGFSGQQLFSSRVISDGTLRLLALLAILNDPNRKGTLCFEEPENGIHEGRVPMLVDLLRNAAQISFEDDQPSFQILLNSHSPIVMAALKDDELVSAESVVTIDPKKHSRSTQTRMRVYSEPGNLFNPEKHLTRSEIKRLLQMPSDAA